MVPGRDAQNHVLNYLLATHCKSSSWYWTVSWITNILFRCLTLWSQENDKCSYSFYALGNNYYDISQLNQHRSCNWNILDWTLPLYNSLSPNRYNFWISTVWVFLNGCSYLPNHFCHWKNHSCPNCCHF